MRNHCDLFVIASQIIQRGPIVIILR
jgi:hypothetical protein